MLNILKAKRPNVIAVVRLLLQSLSIKISDSTIKNSLRAHPEYPSLFSISDSLTGWGIFNQSYRIAKSDYNPKDLEYPFIAHSIENGGLFMVVHDISNGKVVYSDENHKRSIYTEDEFLKKWSGVALYAVANNESNEQNYLINKVISFFSGIKLQILVAAFILVLAIGIDTDSLNIGFILIIILKLSGLIVSILLLIHIVDNNNPFIQNLCTGESNNDCNALLKSKAAKITHWLSWSEIGFFYFAGSLLMMLLVPSLLTLVIWLNVFSLPYTLYSIGYQYRHRNWCKLCCSVQVILWLELLSNISLNHSAFTFNFSVLGAADIIRAISSFILPILFWAVLKPLLMKTVQHGPLKKQLNKFMYNTELFNKALVSQPRYSIPDDLKPIILGNPDANNTITMVSNPFCYPCRLAHEELHELLKIRGDIKLKVILTTTENDTDPRKEIFHHITSLKENNPDILTNALNDWYKQDEKDYRNWAKKYPIEKSLDVDNTIKYQQSWCQMVEIKGTPTFFINGYKFPEPYKIGDLKYILS